MVNRGVEITLSGEIIRQKDFSWNASLLYAFNRNKVKHISVQPSLWDSRISMPTSYPMWLENHYMVFMRISGLD